jgi:glycosyltransferase involved in cell wall biosynthesis
VPRVIVLADQIDATYYATFHFAFQYLQAERRIDFAVMSSGAVRKALSRIGTRRFVEHLTTTATPHAVVFCRFATPCGRELIELFRGSGVRTFYYCDDDLLNIPGSLGRGVLAVHGVRQVVDARRACLASADRVLVSTAHLGAVLGARFPAQAVDVLLYPPYLTSLMEPVSRKVRSAEDQSVTIGYMGSKGHQEDLLMIVPALIGILERFPHVRFETFGTVAMPDAVRRFGQQVTAYGPTNSYSEFLQTLHHLDWDVGLAPLRNNAFNLCRSPIKFLEYTACGIPTVASDISVYRSVMESGGGLLVQDHDWDAALERAVKDQTFGHVFLDRARAVCAERFSLPEVAERIVAALQIN